MNPRIEALIQKHLQGALSEGELRELKELAQSDPAHTEQILGNLSAKLGPAPEAWVQDTVSKLDPKWKDIWRAYETDRAHQLLRMGQWLFLFVIFAGAGLGWKWFCAVRKKPKPFSEISR